MDGGNGSLNCSFVDHRTVECNGLRYYLPEELVNASSGLFWGYLLGYFCLVMFAGLMSGLTMGLLSLDILSLEVLRRGGKPHEQRYASRILHLVRRHHLLLVTLLLANAVAVETMPIFLSKLTSEVVAIIVSVTAVLVFGEIIPQAVCTRFGLAIGYYCAPLVWVLLAVFFPVTFPIAVLLDKILGKEHNTFFRRAELRELVKLHGDGSHANEEPLNSDEVLIVKSALEMRDKVVADVMTPLESVFMLSMEENINREVMNEILHRGHSRVPVFSGCRDNIVGILLVKRLIHLDPDDCTPISSLEGASVPPPSCVSTVALFDLLNKFQTGRSHLYLVYTDGPDVTEPQLVGIITLEDVIEELIGEEIVDETDLYVDVHKRIAVARARVSFHRQSASDPVQTPPTPPTHHRRWQRSMSQPFVSVGKMLLGPLRSSAMETRSRGHKLEEEVTVSASVPAGQPHPRLSTIAETTSPSPQTEGSNWDPAEDDTAPLLDSS